MKPLLDHLARHLSTTYYAQKVREIERASKQACEVVFPSKLEELDPNAIRMMQGRTTEHRLICETLGGSETHCVMVQTGGRIAVQWLNMVGPVGKGYQLGYIQAKHVDWLSWVLTNRLNVLPDKRPYVVATVTGLDKPSRGVNILIHNLMPVVEAMQGVSA